MTQTKSELLVGLSEHLRTQRDSILAAWRKASDADPGQTTVRSLTRGQFNDHIPEVLDAFEQRLRSRPGGSDAHAAGRDEKEEEGKHGLHRWQQGYRLQELIHEWGHLQLCLFEEFEAYAARHPEFEHATHAEANRQMITLVNEAISGSTAQYERLQKAEAAGHVRDLESAFGRVNEIAHRRAELIHQAVHDLRSNVQSVNLAAAVLGDAGIAEADRLEFATLVRQGTESVGTMLGELMELARLEAGQERREVVAFDAADLLVDLGCVIQPTARQRGLFLKLAGPPNLSVEGDPGKVRRLLQNLLLNALKYTVEGGVILSWGEEKENWWVMVKDTGPGLLAGPGAPMVVGLKEATASAREADEKTAATKGETSRVLAPPAGATTAMRKPNQQPGEGIGLSIVKRICELLDASLEMASSAETGTTFRVVMPRSYEQPPAAQLQFGGSLNSRLLSSP